MVSIALSGGAIRGANQVGVLRRVQELGLKVDVITGTSVGALNGVMFAQGDIDLLERIWLKEITDRSKIIRHWLIPIVPWLWKGGLYDAAPLKEMIDRYVDPKRVRGSKAKFFGTMTNLKTKELQYFTNYTTGISGFVYASAAMPVVMEPYVDMRQPSLKDKPLYADGGIREIVPVRKCVEESRKNSDIIVVLASEKPRNRKAKVNKWFGSSTIAGVEAALDEIHTNDIVHGDRAYWSKSDRIKVIKTKPRFDNPFDVDPKKIALSIEDGYNAAKKALG